MFCSEAKVWQDLHKGPPGSQADPLRTRAATSQGLKTRAIQRCPARTHITCSLPLTASCPNTAGNLRRSSPARQEQWPTRRLAREALCPDPRQPECQRQPLHTGQQAGEGLRCSANPSGQAQGASGLEGQSALHRGSTGLKQPRALADAPVG